MLVACLFLSENASKKRTLDDDIMDDNSGSRLLLIDQRSSCELAERRKLILLIHARVVRLRVSETERKRLLMKTIQGYCEPFVPSLFSCGVRTRVTEENDCDHR